MNDTSETEEELSKLPEVDYGSGFIDPVGYVESRSGHVFVCTRYGKRVRALLPSHLRHSGYDPCAEQKSFVENLYRAPE